MIKKEWKFIGRNRLILISVIVMTIIPFLYSIFFLKSVWDPYGSTQDLPVAVVNEDRPVHYNGKKMNVGQQTIKKLKKNKQLDWHIVSKKQAAQGLKDRKYYTVITIPSNFSKNAATVLSAKPKKMQLKYETNDSLNYIGEVISQVGASSLEKEIRTAVTNAYASAMFEQLHVLGSGMKQAASGASQLNNGTATLSDGLNQYTAGVSQVSNGIQTLNVKVSPLAGGIQQLQQGVQPLASGVGQLANGSNQLSSGLQQLQSALASSTSGDQQAQLNQLTSALPQINSGIQQLNQQLQASSGSLGGIDQLTGQISGIGTQAQTIGANLKEAGATLQNISQSAGGTTSDPSASANGIAQAVINALGPDTLTADQQATITSAVTQAVAQSASQGGQADIAGALQSVAANLQNASAADQQIAAHLQAIQQAAPQLQQINTQINQLQASVAQLAQASNVALPGANQAITQLNSGLSNIQGAVNGNGSQPGLLGGANQLSSGLNQMNQMVPTLTNGVNQLGSGSGQLTSGIQQLANGASALQANSGMLTGGAQQLANGSDQLGLALTDGAQQVNSIKAGPKNADMFAAPTKLRHTNYSYVPNYGHALAPYVLSVALYVGALVFNFAYPIRKVSETGKSATQWFLSKVSVGAVVAVAMGVLEAGLIMVGGLQIDHVAQFFATAVAFSLCAMFVIMFLSMTFDNPGRFVAMVLLMLQLGGSGGTFPMEITNHFFNVIHPYLPMTYSILSFRQSITSGLGTTTFTSSVLILVAITIVALILLWLAMIGLQKIHLNGVSQLDDNQKLQAVEEYDTPKHLAIDDKEDRIETGNEE
ncbi:MAG: YhgE/Pip domain-containing protein [Lactobacillus sp.]|uniref:YhgE/Pip family protein n=1 Tax=Bombilactobacillus bombi TaxID=1303590 RepID=UPI0035EB0EE7|nr:YhgE/Pip domain-containing protein [Lactobacillus sp.]